MPKSSITHSYHVNWADLPEQFERTISANNSNSTTFRILNENKVDIFNSLNCNFWLYSKRTQNKVLWEMWQYTPHEKRLEHCSYREVPNLLSPTTQGVLHVFHMEPNRKISTYCRKSREPKVMAKILSESNITRKFFIKNI